MLYNFPNHIKGDTYGGTSFTITVNTIPLDLTGASIKMSLKSNKSTSKSDLDLTTANNRIKIVTAASGIFQVPSQVIDLPAGLYYYDIQITLANKSVKTYIEGQWKILQDITG